MQEEYLDSGFVLTAGYYGGEDEVVEYLRENNGYYESVPMMDATKYQSFEKAQKAADLCDSYGVKIHKVDENGVVEEVIGKRDKPKKEPEF